MRSMLELISMTTPMPVKPVLVVIGTVLALLLLTGCACDPTPCTTCGWN